MYGTVFVYNDLLFYILGLCCVIPVWVFLLLGWQVFSYYGCCSLNGEDNIVEFVWTVVPCLLVGLLCYYNLQCVGASPVLIESEVVKVVGRQWYWSYFLSSGESYDSLILDFVNSVNKPLRLNYLSRYQLLVTASDVIHSFAVTDLGLKVDAIPGRINRIFFIPNQMGVFVGYCSELCGAGHAYMPIVIEVVKEV